MNLFLHEEQENIPMVALISRLPGGTGPCKMSLEKGLTIAFGEDRKPGGDVELDARHWSSGSHGRGVLQLELGSELSPLELVE